MLAEELWTAVGQTVSNRADLEGERKSLARALSQYLGKKEVPKLFG